MRRRGTNVIGLLVPQDPITSLVDYETVLGINQGLEAQGYVLALIRASEVAPPGPAESGDGPAVGAVSRHPSVVFQERMLDGMVVLGPITPAMCRLVEHITPACLWMDTNVLSERNCLRRDEYHAGRLVATQLVLGGYGKLIYVTPIFHDTVPHYSYVDRARGVADVAAEAGVELVERSIDFTGPVCEDVITAMAAWLKPDVGIITATDRTAMALLVQTSRLGLRPGIDVGLAACDRTEHAQRYWPGLSCVNVKRFDLGLEAAGMMVQVLKSPQHTCPAKSVQWAWHEGDTTPKV